MNKPTSRSSKLKTDRRRTKGDHSVFWNEKRGRFIAVATVGYTENGKVIRRECSGTSKSSALKALRKKVAEYNQGLGRNQKYLVKDAIDDWLASSHRWTERTEKRNRNLCEDHIIPFLGNIKVKQLTAHDVDAWLKNRALYLTGDTLLRLRGFLSESLKWAISAGRLDRNVAASCATPAGVSGRPSKALTLEQVRDVLRYCQPDPFYPYIVLSLLTGMRTEEVRALRWERLHLNSDPPHVEIWASARTGGDTKTKSSRRTLALPAVVVDVMLEYAAKEHPSRRGLVFPGHDGKTMSKEAALRRFRAALSLCPSTVPDEWAPRELRHTFVSLMSAGGAPLEEISRLVGHASIRTTESVYRKEIRPMLQQGATTINATLAGPPKGRPDASSHALESAPDCDSESHSESSPEKRA